MWGLFSSPELIQIINEETNMKTLFENWRQYIEEDEQLEEGVYDQGIFKAVFLAGGPGSGKSYIASRTTGGQGFKVLNSDRAFEYLMKQAGLSLDMSSLSADEEKAKDEIRARAKELTSKQKANWCRGRLGQVIDGTGRDFKKIQRLRQDYEEMGYDTYMVFVNTSLEATKKWNQTRERKVPEDILVPAWQSVQNNMGRFQQLFGKSNFAIIDNTPAASPEEMEQLWNIISKDFARRPIANSKAKAWIDTEKGVCEIPLPSPERGGATEPLKKPTLPENLERGMKINVKK